MPTRHTSRYPHVFSPGRRTVGSSSKLVRPVPLARPDPSARPTNETPLDPPVDPRPR